MTEPTNETTALLVVGAAGMTAVPVGRHARRHVGHPGRWIRIAASSQARRAGYNDSVERGREYLRFETGEHAPEDLIRRLW